MEISTTTTNAQTTGLVKGLGLFDSTTLVMGSMIGSGVFIVAADIGRQVQSPGLFFLTWIIGGLMTVVAAVSYGELAGMMPQAGGQYIYLREAFGPLFGFPLRLDAVSWLFKPEQWPRWRWPSGNFWAYSLRGFPPRTILLNLGTVRCFRPPDCPYRFFATVDCDPGGVFPERAEHLWVASGRGGSKRLHGSEGRGPSGSGGAGILVGFWPSCPGHLPRRDSGRARTGIWPR